MYSWEKEKAYKAKRAAAAAQEMEAAIEAVDLPRFLAAYETAMRYMNARPRNQYYRRMLAASSAARKGNIHDLA